MLFNEPKLLKLVIWVNLDVEVARFSALQRAEIAEMLMCSSTRRPSGRFSALQRAEIAEIS